MSQSITSAVLDAILADTDALDQLAAALSPRLSAAQPTSALTTSQAAARAGVHERTIRRALSASTLNGYTIAGRWRIDADALEVWLDRGAPTTASTPAVTNGRPRTPRGNGADAIAGTNTRSAT